MLLLQADTSAVATTPASLSLLDLLMKGGVVMIPILILSVMSVYFIIERYFYISRAAADSPNFMNEVRERLQAARLKDAQHYCETQNNAIGRIIATGIGFIGNHPESIEAAMEDSANIEIGKMEQSLYFLGLIAGIAPMLGFIGTIAGIIRIFYDISLTDNISIGIIAGGLYEKMITSGTGLVVGVIAYSGFHWLQSRIDRFILKMQQQTLQFKSFLLQKV
ncbi:MAG: MotA/TolQ/ExbB proton channel family protein [Sphingobacteriales bacterium]|nr:MotA/TolQ/ExbB proton channel family protein [Sphingobacteriales bacterium]